MRTRTSSRTRPTARAAAAAAAGLMLLTAAGAPPATGTPDSVDATDFPGVRQVAEILPAFAGGDRHIEDDHAIWVLRRDCLSYRDGPSGEVRKWAYFYPGDNEPTVLWIHVQQFGSPDEAVQAIRTVRRSMEPCYGRYDSEYSQGTFIRRPADVPPLGAGRPVAWKMNDHWTDRDTGIEMAYYSRRIWMREAETVIGIDLWGEVPQSRKASIRLARLALRTVD